MSISVTQLPEHSILKTIHYDYVDSFAGDLNDRRQDITSTEIGKSFFKSAPKWVELLFALRNKLVGTFGLKTSENMNDRQLDHFKCTPGEQLGIFKVYNKTENEVVLGEDDKHLNFRVSLYLDQQAANSEKKTLTISTAVTFNNFLGRLYFLPVKPFHKIIVCKMLQGIIHQLESSK
ncbi:MAG: DUF2867 domain-containing protein [Siphonobacter sp.]